MTQTSYVNPNGLPADGQITSARDMAILARAIIRDLPEYEYFVHIPSIRFGRRVTHNFNKLIGRYPGADGFKTGFICASGYNLVASATRDGKRLIAVVLGASSGRMRAVRAAQLLDRGFAGNGLAWLRPSLGTVDNLVPIDAHPAQPARGDVRRQAQAARQRRGRGGHRRQRRQRQHQWRQSASAFFASGLQAAVPTEPAEHAGAAGGARPEPIVVYTGPTKTGAALIAAVDADTEKLQPVKRGQGQAYPRSRARSPTRPTTRRARCQEAPRSRCESTPRMPSRMPQLRSQGGSKPAAKACRLPKKRQARPKPKGRRQADGRLQRSGQFVLISPIRR